MHMLLAEEYFLNVIILIFWYLIMLHFVLKTKIWMTKSHRGHLFFHYKCFQVIKRSQETHHKYMTKRSLITGPLELRPKPLCT